MEYKGGQKYRTANGSVVQCTRADPYRPHFFILSGGEGQRSRINYSEYYCNHDGTYAGVLHGLDIVGPYRKHNKDR